ncbi:hypothetical protein [Sphingomonas jatrophae]|nr:hypothetical protein [Sphingomonas jatrophae]
MFDVTDTEGTHLATIFAIGIPHAASLFMAWCLCHDGRTPARISVVERTWGEDNQHARHHREAVLAELAGIGTFDPQSGWLIAPADWSLGGDDRA